jgi:hypothetical protein
MARLQAKWIVGMVGMAFAAAIAFAPAPAEAARMTKAEKAAWKQANVACKAEAKGKKLGWFARRKFVKGCLKEALKGYPNIDIDRLMKDVGGKPLPATHVEHYI